MANVAHHGVIEMEDGPHHIERERSIFLMVSPVHKTKLKSEIKKLIPCLIAEFLANWFILATATAITSMMLYYKPSPFERAFNGLAFPWGMSFTFCIYAIGGVSGAHLNFSVTVSFAAFRGFEWWKTLPYFFAQVLGGTCGTLNMWLTYYPLGYALANGKPLDQSPEMAAAFFNNANQEYYTTIHSFAIQLYYTAFLVFMIFAFTDPYNPMAPGASMFPLLIGLLVMELGDSLGDIGQFTINPSRDLGARIAGAMIGFGHLALPGVGGMLWANQCGSVIGGVVGGLIYESLVRPFFPTVEELGPTIHMKRMEYIWNFLRGRKNVQLQDSSISHQIEGNDTSGTADNTKHVIKEEEKFS
ncbi:Glycerol uptake facilitator protein [Galdieria sulphuraria]|uniref:Aquaglyceroporin related protein, MIP family n=1 Tax=Galdieria sulphuraria TaxID=130081 RepID=M2W285_GALSU|nr:aquaglyceroporin related protein, MIP family [Galdieria sulphuraria]EME29806.1 aquaglyceroporin related protein, MIP family [Galdieria sulphuraria]GJD06795.1 Glycerol uptake facilitator protein [Galdieria sulphuraria]|eukprot:XP_005706326.1 aquaglyceroporin related protein, MIP family [Galdieria sulphuraria]